MLVEEEKIEIEKIISHRKKGNKLEYQIKFQGYDQEEWVCSSYFAHSKCALLEAYDEENVNKNILNNTKETNSEIAVKDEEVIEHDSYLMDPMKNLALDFAHQFRIKCEIVFEDNNNEEVVDTQPDLDNIQFGAAEFDSITNSHKNVIFEVKKEKSVISNHEENVDVVQKENIHPSSDASIESSSLLNVDPPPLVDIVPSAHDTVHPHNVISDSSLLSKVHPLSHVILDTSPHTNIFPSSHENVQKSSHVILDCSSSLNKDPRNKKIQPRSHVIIDTSPHTNIFPILHENVQTSSFVNIAPSTSADIGSLSESSKSKPSINGKEPVIKDVSFYEDIEGIEIPETHVNITGHNDAINKQNSVNDSLNKISRIGKIKKASKPTTEVKHADEKKTVKSLLLPSQLSATPDTFDQIFYNLPVLTKVIPEVPETTEEKLKSLTLDTLLNMVNKNNVAMLQKYSRGYLKNNLEHMVKNNHYFLVKAAENSFISMVSALLELGADVNGRDLNGLTPLMVACDFEKEDIIDLLINNGASINRTSDGKNDLLMRCIKNKKSISFKFLLNAGIDFSSIESQILEPALVKILDDHKKNLIVWIEESILVQLGPNAKVNQIVLAPRVLSLFEVQDTKVEVIFPSHISAIIENHCNLLFLVTGLLHGSSMKCLISDANKITSVNLNDMEQQYLNDGKHVSVTSFNPLHEGLNKLVVRFENDKCRKIRLILVAFNVIVKE